MRLRVEGKRHCSSFVLGNDRVELLARVQSEAPQIVWSDAAVSGYHTQAAISGGLERPEAGGDEVEDGAQGGGAEPAGAGVLAQVVDEQAE